MDVNHRMTFICNIIWRLLVLKSDTCKGKIRPGKYNPFRRCKSYRDRFMRV